MSELVECGCANTTHLYYVSITNDKRSHFELNTAHEKMERDDAAGAECTVQQHAVQRDAAKIAAVRGAPDHAVRHRAVAALGEQNVGKGVFSERLKSATGSNSCMYRTDGAAKRAVNRGG
jgi:hypothetical protein